MPIKVPGVSIPGGPSARGPKPTENDLMMALATMHKLGRVPKKGDQKPTPMPEITSAPSPSDLGVEANGPTIR